MNYIKRLQNENHDHKIDKKEAVLILESLQTYLCSSKFRNGDLAGYVNITDVLNEIGKAKSVITDERG